MIVIICPHCGFVFNVAAPDDWSTQDKSKIKAIIVECPECGREAAAVCKV